MKTLRGVIKTDDRELITRVTGLLKGFGAFPRAVHWNVTLPDGSKMEPPMIGFHLDEEQMAEVVNGFEHVGVVVYTLSSDPVKDHAFLDESELEGEKYVVVKWMNPLDRGLGIVDTDDTQFVSVLDLSEFPAERENEELITVLCNTLQQVANEMNRLHAQVREALTPPRSKTVTGGRLQ